MHRLAAALAVLVAGSASAQPITRPSEAPCTVRVLEAPDAVRAEIERWVRAEPRCERELDVRVTRVRGGLRLVATSADGRLRERVIPDAQSAAVLVVSWMADDSIDDALDAATPVEIAPAPVVPLPKPPPSDDGESPLGPSLHGRTPARLLRHRWLSLGAAAGDGGVGAHAQVDMLSLGAWSLGLAGSVHEAPSRADMRAPGSLGTATVFAAYTHSFGRFDARAQLGIGAAVERRGADRMGPGDVSVEPALEAGAFIRLHLGDDWGVLAGPLVDVRGDGRIDVSGFLGLERRL